MRKFINVIIVVPIAVLILAFAIANRQEIPVSFDPLANPPASAAAVTAPLFVLLFLALILGTFLGGIATWMTQGAHRRRAREAREDAERWREEARRLREQPPTVVGSGARSLARASF